MKPIIAGIGRLGWSNKRSGTEFYAEIGDRRWGHRARYPDPAGLLRVLRVLCCAGGGAGGGAVSRCRSCDAPVRWVKTQAGKNIPLDPEPGEGGNIELVDGVALYRNVGEDGSLFPALYTSHFVTCPDASKWRRP